MPFKFHRALVMNVSGKTKTHAFSPGRCVQVVVQVLSQLQTGTDSTTDMNIRPFLKLVDTRFYGMSHQIETQMDAAITSVAAAAAPSVRDAVLNAGRIFKGGTRVNNDKPSDVSATVVVPRPRLGFCSGKGATDIVPMRNDPFALTDFSTVHAPSDEPQTTLQICRIWGLKDRFAWAATAKPNTRLWSMNVMPGLNRAERDLCSPTPLDYIVGTRNRLHRRR